jgi:hypothetical protein
MLILDFNSSSRTSSTVSFQLAANQRSSMVLFTVIPAAEDKWTRLACETSTLLQDPEPRHVEGLPDLITYPLPQPGAELVRNFYHAKVR